VSNEPVLTDLQDGVLLVTLNRPTKKNAFDNAQWLGLRDVLRDARNDAQTGVVVATGAGNDFSAGQDLSQFVGTEGEAHPFQLCMRELYDFDKPLLAAVKGVGVGFGATFLFHCDVVYLGESARLRLPFVSLGLVPEAASSYTLQMAIGAQRAAELFYTAEWIDAQRAMDVGIAARTFADAEVLDETLAKAREMAQWPVSALQATKRTLKAVHSEAITAADATEFESMMVQAGSPENVEAITAFLQKRKPDFRNLPPRQ